MTWNEFLEDTLPESRWSQEDWEDFVEFFLEEGNGNDGFDFRKIITKFVEDGINIDNMFEDVIKILIEHARYAHEFLDDFEFFKNQVMQLDGFKFFDISFIQKHTQMCFEDYLRGCEFAAKLISMFWDKLSAEFCESLQKNTENSDISNIEDDDWWEYEDGYETEDPSLILLMFWKHLKFCVPQLH
jgi:hypothetical protein